MRMAGPDPSRKEIYKGLGDLEMGRRTLTKELYESIVEGYREAPGNFTHAARCAGIGWAAAKKAWEIGWPERTWAPPIKDIIAKEMEIARLKRIEAEEEQAERDKISRQKLRDDAVKTAEQEARAVVQARGNAMGLSSVISKLLLGSLPLADRIKDELEKGSYTPQQALKIFVNMAYIVRQGTEAIRLALEMERTRLTEPIHDSLLKDIENITPGEAVKQLESVQRTIERAKKLGWAVIQGGDGPTTVTIDPKEVQAEKQRKAAKSPGKGDPTEDEGEDEELDDIDLDDIDDLVTDSKKPNGKKA